MDAIINRECPFLHVFPLEIRLKVYEYLLVRKILGMAQSVTQTSRFGADLKYDLCPEVLRLCRQIYKEALPFLYGKNTFYISCFRVDNHPVFDQSFDSVYRQFYESDRVLGYETEVDGPQVELCPLTRYENCETVVPYPVPDLCHYTTVPRVRNWRVVVSRIRDPGGHWDPTWCLIDFCLSISAQPPISLEVLVLPCGLDYSENESYAFWECDDVLSPLRLLRNLQKCVIKEACASDVPDIIRLAGDDIIEAISARGIDYKIPENLKTEIETLVTSQEPIDLRHMMHKSLTTYAQAFERYRPYKMQMGLRRESIEQIGNMDIEYAEFLDAGAFNPFINPTMHPVEYDLQICKEASVEFEEEDDTFKPHRRNVLTYLERQWTRIENANRTITEFIKEEKVLGGLFDIAERLREQLNSTTHGNANASQIYDHEKVRKISLAMVYLEDYAASFKRDLTHTTRAQIIPNRRLFESHYDLPRERLIAQMAREIETGKILNFINDFSTAVDMCDDQYLEILAARKKVFQFDGLGQFECGDFDRKLGYSLDRIDWTVYEPDLTPFYWLPYEDFDEDDDVDMM
ncbi:74e68f26-9f09-417a-bcb2-879139476eac [Sclerotinia trifoliorum]|uniref:74e68f26-9f09-417a-bcb2-879139476eac n=1 Tax=Sclerotinia trifoliorum TaxID=28548 RepID=A0A8H2VSC3_9HELO|nr:74e68f26-9f09-417a-bcb2-879139476eac [Sclerotinia trifoliorum]